MGLVLPVVFVGLARRAGRQDRRFAAGALLGAAGLVFLLGATIFTLFGRLTTEVDASQVRASFGWVNVYSRAVPLTEVQEARAVQYRPMDHGGWGIRGTQRDQILSQTGDQGVKLQLANGTLLLGSQQPEELATAINEARRR